MPLFECAFAHELPNFLDLWRRELAEELVVCRCRPRGERLSYHRSWRAHTRDDDDDDGNGDDDDDVDDDGDDDV